MMLRVLRVFWSFFFRFRVIYGRTLRHTRDRSNVTRFLGGACTQKNTRYVSAAFLLPLINLLGLTVFYLFAMHVKCAIVQYGMLCIDQIIAI